MPLTKGRRSILEKTKASLSSRVAAVLAACLFLGCAKTDKGPFFLHPDTGLINASKAYAVDNEKIVFNGSSVRLSASLIRDAPHDMPQTIKRLHEKGNIIISMEIENNSERKVLFDPTHVSLIYDKGVSIDRPLDYTDIFEQIVNKREDAEFEAEEELRGIKSDFYYMPLTIGPGQREQRLLIFHSLPQSPEDAELTIRELYIGRQSIDIAFPFIVKGQLP
ncbi:MAG: hypothetical protein AABZ23_01745 [Deltaproteobacteria bacterium]